MRRSRAKFWAKRGMVAAAMTLGLLVAMKVIADGAGMRDATADEKAFHQTVYDTIAKALPPGPAGWTLGQDSSASRELKQVDQGSESYPRKVEYWTTWSDIARINEGMTKLVMAMQSMDKVPPAQMEQYVKDATMKAAVKDATLRSDVKVNLLYQGFYGKFASQPAIAGGQVFRSDSHFNKDGGWEEGVTLVFLGKNWKHITTGGDYMEAAADKSLPSLAVQTILIKIKADPERAKQILAKTDWEALKKLLK